MANLQSIIIGTGGNDVLVGTADSDTINGLAGDDTLDGGAGNDILDGGEGGDVLKGGAGADIINGGAGSDTVIYADAASGVSIDLTKSSSTWTGDAQGDTLTSIETIQLTKFADIFRGDANSNFANGGEGNDQMVGGGGDDTFTGDSGNDAIHGGDGNDFIVGDDFGNHVLAGDDFLQGNAGDDRLFGGGGNDKLVGGTGNDRLAGEQGADFLIGNEGADTFRYFSVTDSFLGTVNGVSQQDQIADFTQGEDKIDLSAIDANVALGGNQAFAFLADPADHTGDWTGLVWGVTDARGITTIFASNDGDADAEMQIFMSHGYTFTAGDFIL
jgi:Ca2+-binding RTX toxin-like protein